MLKSKELATPTSCLNKAAADEPLFVLRAKDPVAAMTIRHWATMAAGTHEPEKIADAIAVAELMEVWQTRQTPEAIAEAAPAPR